MESAPQLRYRIFFTRNAKILEKYNVYYPDFLGPKNHIWLSQMSYDKSNPRIEFAKPFLQEINKNDWKHFNEVINAKINFLKSWLRERKDGDKIIFSSEWLCDLKINEIIKFKDIISDMDVEKIIICVRDPFSHIASIWFQNTVGSYPAERQNFNTSIYLSAI